MSRHYRQLASVFLRISLFATFFVGPVGAFAMANAGSAGPGSRGIGFILLMTLQRVG
jgi:hypothetical protein